MHGVPNTATEPITYSNPNGYPKGKGLKPLARDLGQHEQSVRYGPHHYPAFRRLDRDTHADHIHKWPSAEDCDRITSYVPSLDIDFSTINPPEPLALYTGLKRGCVRQAVEVLKRT